jgi:hypothetical protein
MTIIVKIHEHVVDVTEFVKQHPGGEQVLAKYHQQDATKAFERVGHSPQALEWLRTLPQGSLDAIQETTKELVVDPVHDFGEKAQNGMDFVWYTVSALCGAFAVAFTSMASSFGEDLQKGHPKAGELGRGRFPIIGYVPGGGFNYPFRLQDPTVVSIVTAWVGYTIHQVGQFYILFAAKRARDRGELTWGGWNRYSSAMFKWNAVFIFLHFIQSMVFYDGLASTVPEVSAQGSVIAMLVVVYILEVPRRGLIFGTRPFEKRELWKEFCQFSKKYHGYVASFGIVYNFWYHPMEASGGHLSGFMFKFLLFWQSSLLFHRNHRNRYWSGFVESFVTIHAFLTAIFQTGQVYLMFLNGFLFSFMMIQFWGFPVIYNYLNLPTEEKERTKRWRIVLASSLFAYLAFAVTMYAAAGAIRNVWMIVTIPAMLYLSIFIYLVGFALAYYVEKMLVNKKVLERKSVLWYGLATLWAFVFNVMIVLHYAIYFRADILVPKRTRDYFSSPK